MIALIVNADDLGSSPARDRGIIEAFRDGLVTSASLLANGPSFATAAALAADAGLPVGVHLNLSEGVPLTGPIAGLTDRSGRFPGKRALRACLAAAECDLAAVRGELAAQVGRVLESGLRPDHLDSHQHCHIFPCLTGMIAELAATFDIAAARSPRPGEPPAADPGGELGRELALYRDLAGAAHATLNAAGLRTPDGLWGVPLLDRLDTPRLCTLLEQLPAGCWELMTHPGYPTPGGGAFDGPPRQTELEALRAGRAREIVVRRDIRLVSFGALPCAS